MNALEKTETLRQSDDLAERCRQSAAVRFDLEELGGMKYRRLYKKLTERCSGE